MNAMMETPDLEMMKMMKEAMMEGQRGASMAGQHVAPVASFVGPHCPHIPLCFEPGNPARDTRKNSRKKRVGQLRSPRR